MHTINTYPYTLIQVAKTTLLSGAKRIWCFIALSLVLHSLLFALLPGLEPGSSNDVSSLRLPITLSLNTAAPKTQAHPDQPAAAEHVSARRQSGNAPKPASSDNKPQNHPQQILADTASPTRTMAKHFSERNTPTRHLHAPDTVAAISAPQQDKNDKGLTGSVQMPLSTPDPNPAAVALLLRRALRQHFYYPPFALQNGWEGKVVLGMRVTADGQVGEARVVRASGYGILDRAARHAANDIGKLPAARPLLAGQSLRFRVPVVYRLQH